MKQIIIVHKSFRPGYFAEILEPGEVIDRSYGEDYNASGKIRGITITSLANNLAKFLNSTQSHSNLAYRVEWEISASEKRKSRFQNIIDLHNRGKEMPL